MKTTVIFHKADYDGIFCREIARKFLPEAQLIGWDYGDETPTLPEPSRLYMLDISVEPLMERKNLVWIDHHKSAIEKYAASFLPSDPFRTLYCIDGVAACRLAWQFFRGMPTLGSVKQLPIKEEYKTRQVIEPLAVRLAGEYDVWDHWGDGDLEFQFGLDSRDKLDWSALLTVEFSEYTQSIVADGAAAMACYRKRDADIMRDRSFLTTLDGGDGLKFLALNTARCNSQTFAARDVPETGHDALMAFYFNGHAWKFSLYHAAHRTDLDLSKIAVRFGGGGHRGACGFERKSVDFLWKLRTINPVTADKPDK